MARQLLAIYKSDLGLLLTNADNSLASGIYEVWTALSEGRLKIFATLVNWFAEYRIYRRDDKGAIVKENDHLMDACVIGETKVATSEGWVPIVELVGRDGWVVTRGGALGQFFCGARLTIEAALVVDVLFEDGSRVRCTRDHPFLTPAGWVSAAGMTGYRCYNGVTQRIQWRAAWTRRLSVRRVKSFAAFVTIAAARISGAMGGRSIATCGLSTTIGLASQRGSRSTTVTWTPRTTGTAISSCYPRMSTWTCTNGLGTSEASHPQLHPPLPTGTDRKPGERGMPSITPRWARPSIRRLSSFASTAVSHLWRRSLGCNRFCSNACKS